MHDCMERNSNNCPIYTMMEWEQRLKAIYKKTGKGMMCSTTPMVDYDARCPVMTHCPMMEFGEKLSNLTGQLTMMVMARNYTQTQICR